MKTGPKISQTSAAATVSSVAMMSASDNGEALHLVKGWALVGALIQLTKPRIIFLFLVTGMATLVLEGSTLQDPVRFVMISLGILLSGASANALNQYFDRDIDAVMERTRNKRPLPQGKLSPDTALFFALSIGFISMALLYYFGNWQSCFWGWFTIVFYVGIYTLWLKRSTPYNIVIGGAAGATAPLIAWSASAGHLNAIAWVLFMIVFMWTPPHFWALALCIKDEYAKVSVPMLPVVEGEETTRRQIFFYSLSLLPLTMAPYFLVGSSERLGGPIGKWYLLWSMLLSFEFIRRAWKTLRANKIEEDAVASGLAARATDSVSTVPSKSHRGEAWALFGYSIIYLFLVFLGLTVAAIW